MTEVASPLDVHNRVLRAADRRLDRLEERLAELLLPILERAGATAAARFQRRATDHLTAAADGVTSLSTMIALKPRPEEAQAIAQAGGAAWETLHVTLAYLGDVEGDLTPVADALRPVAASHAPLTGVVGGVGIFSPSPEGIAPAIALPDVPGLVELRVAATEALASAGVDFSRIHGFCAHLTLAYFDATGDAVGFQEPLPMGEPLHFDALLVVRGDVVEAEIPLVGVPPITASVDPFLRDLLDAFSKPIDDPGRPTDRLYFGPFDPPPGVRLIPGPRGHRGTEGPTGALESGDRCRVCGFYYWGDERWHSYDEEQERPVAPGTVLCEWCAYRPDGQASLSAAADPPGWSSPAGDEIVDVEALTKAIRAKTDPVRRALVEAAMTPTLKQAGLDFDVTNPFTAKVLAQSGSHVTHIAETTRANVMRTVKASYEQGLSIPETAKAIQAGMRDASPARARMIARTELAGAVNGGSLAATRIVSGVTGDTYYKEWLTAAGALFPRHEEYDGLDGQTVALDENFDVGGSPLEFPGDPAGDPAESINCRCSLAYTDRPPGEDGVAPDQTSGGQDALAEEMPDAPPPGDTVSVRTGPFVSPAGLEKIDRLGLAEWPPKKDALARQVFGRHTDTVGLYKQTGQWTADRQGLHDAIVEAHFQGKLAAGAKTRRAYFTSGGGASGKSHALFKLGGKEVSLDELAARPDTVAIDPDRIKAMLPEYTKLRDAGDPYAASGVHEESSEIAKRIQQEAYDRGLSVLVDTTGSSSSFVSKLEAAKAAGYEVKVSMFSIPTNEAIMRSLARGDRSGRYVSLGALKNAHAGASRQLGIWKDSPALERWQVWDNSGTAPRLIAEGAGGETSVYDQQAFDAILAKANEQ